MDTPFSNPTGFDLHRSRWRNNLNGITNMFPYLDPPTSLVRSYYVPTAQEYSTIGTLLSSSGFAISALASAISDLQLTTSFLQLRLKQYGAYSELQGSLLSPIRKLPDELLGHILTYVCDDTVEVASTSPGSIWDLQQVCVRWRNVLQHIQSLWCDFEMDFFSDTKKPGHAAIIRRIQSCLNYSGSLPLTISLRPERYYAFPIPALANIGVHSDRWESLIIVVDLLIDAAKETDFEVIIRRHGLSRLRRLALVGGSFSDSYSYHVFKGATNLQEVQLSYSIMPGVENFPWSNVKKLVLSTCKINSEDELSSTLRAMTSLEELAWISNYFEIEPSKTIMLPSLRTLSVTCHEGELDFPVENGHPPRNFPMLCTPQLSELEIVGEINQFQAVASVVRRSASSVKCLDLQSYSASFILQVIKELSNIEELILPFPGKHLDFLLQKLIRNPEITSEGIQLLPLLRKIVLRSANLDDRTISLLMDVMRSRSFASAAATQNQTIHATHLSQVACIWYENNPSFVQLEDLGKELGIEVTSGPQSGEVTRLYWDPFY